MQPKIRKIKEKEGIRNNGKLVLVSHHNENTGGQAPLNVLSFGWIANLGYNKVGSKLVSVRLVPSSLHLAQVFSPLFTSG